MGRLHVWDVYNTAGLWGSNATWHCYHRLWHTSVWTAQQIEKQIEFSVISIDQISWPHGFHVNLES